MRKCRVRAVGHGTEKSVLGRLTESAYLCVSAPPLVSDGNASAASFLALRALDAKARCATGRGGGARTRRSNNMSV
jgi:hypothetical protein